MKGIQDKIRKLAFMGPGTAEGGLGQPVNTENAGTEEGAFITQISNIMKSYMESKFPWLHPESTLSILDVDMDKNTINASYDLKLADKSIRIPLLFQNGNIVEPWAIFMEDEKRMYPLSEKWYKKIINSLTDDLGVVDNMSTSAYWNAVNSSNDVLNSNVVRGVRGYHYAALNKLNLMELMPIVKKSMLNGYIYDTVGRTAIKVAAQKYLATKIKKTKKSSRLILNEGAFIITKDTLKKVAGLSFTESSELYTKLLTQDWCLHYKGNISKKADMVDVLSVPGAEEDVAHSVSSTFMLNQPARMWGSYNKYTGEPLFLIPDKSEPTLSATKSFKNKNYQLEEVGGLWNKTIILNADAVETFGKLIESMRVKTVPPAIKKALDGVSTETGSNDVNRGFFLVPTNFSKETFVIPTWEYSIGDDLDTLDIYGEQNGYLKGADGVLYAIVLKDDFSPFITFDAETFVRKAPSLEEYVRGGFKVKKTFNNTYDMEFTSPDSKKVASIKNANKKVASFILGNYVHIPAADKFLDKNIEFVNKQYKFAAQIDPEVQNQLMAAIEQIGSMIANIETPEDQKKVLDGSGKGGGITVNIDTLNIGGQPQDAAMPPEGMPAEGAAPVAGGEMPPLDQLLAELTNLGIPPEIVDMILQAAEATGSDPTELVIEVGSFVESNTAQGVPLQQIIATLQEQLSGIVSQTSAPGMQPVVGAANTPYPTEAAPAGTPGMPAASDAMMQQAGQQMVQQMPPAAPAQMPMTEAMANPNVQQVAAMPGIDATESLNKGVLADIIANATIKTKFIDYLPVLNDTVNAISEMILKVELNRNRLTNEVGTTNIDDVIETLRNVLDQLGSLILEIAQFE